MKHSYYIDVPYISILLITPGHSPGSGSFIKALKLSSNDTNYELQQAWTHHLDHGCDGRFGPEPIEFAAIMLSHSLLLSKDSDESANDGESDPEGNKNEGVAA